MRRTSVFACGENLGGGAIHLPRAFAIPEGGATTGAESKKKDMTYGHVFLFGGDKRDRTADLLNAIQALSQYKRVAPPLKRGQGECFWYAGKLIFIVEKDLSRVFYAENI